jgi:hypothetical protein
MAGSAPVMTRAASERELARRGTSCAQAETEFSCLAVHRSKATAKMRKVDRGAADRKLTLVSRHHYVDKEQV